MRLSDPDQGLGITLELPVDRRVGTDHLGRSLGVLGSQQPLEAFHGLLCVRRPWQWLQFPGVEVSQDLGADIGFALSFSSTVYVHLVYLFLGIA